MGREIAFFKYHGIGNDFIVIEGNPGRPSWLTAARVKFWCDRHQGIGADGVLVIEAGTLAPHFMRILNADGSEAEMCGNGIRCVARHLRDQMGITSERLRIETPAGVKECRFVPASNGGPDEVCVSLGHPLLQREQVPVAGEGDTLRIPVEVAGQCLTGTAVGMGNPHFVVFGEAPGPSLEEARRIGQALSEHPLFPRRTNVEFAHPSGDNRFGVTVFERGAGLTLACGTGAAATAVAAVREGRADPSRSIRIDLAGGSLQLDVDASLREVVLTGPAVEVFRGTIRVEGEDC